MLQAFEFELVATWSLTQLSQFDRYSLCLLLVAKVVVVPGSGPFAHCWWQVYEHSLSHDVVVVVQH